MKVLVACEFSGTVRDAFIRQGHEAVSCDLLDSEAPGPHYKGDVFDIIDDGWDLMIAHPPCTYLTISAEWCYSDNPGRNMKPGTLIGAERRAAREEAIEFFRRLLGAKKIKKKAIENPVGVISSRIRKPNQIIQPHQFGHDASKATCLWLEGLPLLQPTISIPGRVVGINKRGQPIYRWENQTDSGQNRLPPSEDRWKKRSETYAGIANAMAVQWGGMFEFN